MQPQKQKCYGAIAQLVEQWTENPCVPGSIPGGTTIPKQSFGIFCFKKVLPLLIRKITFGEVLRSSPLLLQLYYNTFTINTLSRFCHKTNALKFIRLRLMRLKVGCRLKFSSRIYFVTNSLKYKDMSAEFGASYLHKENFMNYCG